ncbi:MAG: bifunctional folylpolyglutamate synthase/dihydrofolate synthase [Solirubrobacterales bacterium]
MSDGAEILRRREVLGWKLGLDRMARLCSLLGMPQNRFASIHVVGTNGKTSVTQLTAALLEAHGVSTGAYVSPHFSSWRERILIRGEPIGDDAFTEALERAEESAVVADRSAGDEGPITQFELLTAAAFLAFAAARVQYAVIEAGLGGRLDATNVIPSKLTVLTSVGLDHTEWLGETLEEIAAEKVAVLRDHTALVVGDVPEEVEPVIDRAVTEKHAKSARAVLTEPPGLGYQLKNFDLAISAASQALGETDGKAIQEVQRRFQAGELTIPGRLQWVPGDPPTLFDAAHNTEGAAALAEALPAFGGPHVVCCIAILAEKDARAMVQALAGACEAFVCTQIPDAAIQGSGRPSGRSWDPEELAGFCRDAGAEAEAMADPIEAWARARELAGERDGVALAAGSHYLLSSIWTEKPAQSS